MHKGPTLYTWKNKLVDRFGMLSFAHRDTASWPAKGLVGGRGDKICIGDRIRMEPGGDQSGNVGDIDEQIGADRLGNPLESWEIERPRIGARADDEHTWTAFLRKLLHHIIVDGFSLTLHAVGKYTEQESGKIDLTAVGEVAALGEVHSQDSVSWLQYREIGCHIGLGSCMRLHVYMFRAENLLAALDGEILHGIHMLTPTIVAFPRIPFGVLVGHEG